MWSGSTTWVLLFQLLYALLVLGVCLRIMYDTRSVTKTLAYLLFVIFVPIAGIIFYFSFGINYRKRKIYRKKLAINESLKKEFDARILEIKEYIIQSNSAAISGNKGLRSCKNFCHR